MKTETYELLSRLYERHGAQEFGKICQKLLAIAFKKAGYLCVGESERAVQGVDIGEVEKEDAKYSIEVKTTVHSTVTYQKKDQQGLLYKKEKGYQPVLAVLKLHRFGEWYFVRADAIKPGTLYIDTLRPFRLRQLEEEIAPFFDEAVKENFDGTLEEGQGHLDKILKTD